MNYMNDPRVIANPLLRAKLQMLELAAASGNVTYACHRAGFSRDTFYRVKAAFEQRGVDGLIHASTGRKKTPAHNRGILPLEISNSRIADGNIFVGNLAA